MEDIDLTLDRTFSRDRGMFRLFPAALPGSDILQIFLAEDNSGERTFKEMVAPWERTHDDLDRGEYFHFKLRDPYGPPDVEEDYHQDRPIRCDECGKVLRPWDWNMEWGYTYPICHDCRTKAIAEKEDAVFRNSLFKEKSSAANMKL